MSSYPLTGTVAEEIEILVTDLSPVKSLEGQRSRPFGEDVLTSDVVRNRAETKGSEIERESDIGLESLFGGALPEASIADENSQRVRDSDQGLSCERNFSEQHENKREVEKPWWGKTTKKPKYSSNEAAVKSYSTRKAIFDNAWRLGLMSKGERKKAIENLGEPQVLHTSVFDVFGIKKR